MCSGQFLSDVSWSLDDVSRAYANMHQSTHGMLPSGARELTSAGHETLGNGSKPVLRHGISYACIRRQDCLIVWWG